jgi:hypothetical protein
MVAKQTTTIEVDTVAAEIIRRADLVARSQGETLGTYLRHTLPKEVLNGERVAAQAEAWNAFVAGMTSLVEASVPPGHVANDSRDAMYGDAD